MSLISGTKQTTDTLSVPLTSSPNKCHTKEEKDSKIDWLKRYPKENPEETPRLSRFIQMIKIVGNGIPRLFILSLLVSIRLSWIKKGLLLKDRLR